ncbi:hypothetical protein AZF37_06935 [endosymbiont 'TC1' of Trimyema compressum]|nr:AraC family transcriptional regulator [endosymbiont 'TC1' of Trimyema compressum]AMP20933.1 hypothetical protein AZF37_06935 [endosymbiont 'TC1' of Trimyema compressum]
MTIRTNNTTIGIKQIDEIWRDISSGKLPILFDGAQQFLQGISPVSKYSNYESNEKGSYDFSIMAVKSDFFHGLEQAVSTGEYKKYDVSDNDMVAAAKKAWSIVWNEQKEGTIKRAFSVDYESTVPAEYTKDGLARCYLYIAIK